METLLLPGLAAGALVYKGYKTLAVPEELKHLPQIPVSTLISSFAQGEKFDQRYERIIKPFLDEHGCGLMWVQGQWEVMIVNPKHAREILVSSDKFPKRSEESTINDNRLISKLLGISNIVFSDGDEWRRHRRVANPAFKKAWDPEIFGDVMVDVMNKINETCPKSYLNVAELFQQLTLDALGKGLFSYDFESVKKGEDNVNMLMYHKTMRDIAKPLYFMFPALETLVPNRMKAHQNTENFRKFLQEIINERRKEIDVGIARSDLLTRMIQASTAEENSTLTDEEVVNDLAVFFLAGHDTTASTLTTMFHYLGKHPEIQDMARNEVMKVMGNPSKLTVPTTEQIKDMEYISCIIKESMRIMTTVSQLRRFCPEPVTLSDGFHIPANTPIVIQNWGIHHDEEIYPDPYQFNPSRFLSAHSPENNQWMAFGFGSRMCLGMNFSLVEQRVVLAMLLQQYTFHLDPIDLERPLKLTTAGLVRARTVNVQFRPRQIDA